MFLEEGKRYQRSDRPWPVPQDALEPALRKGSFKVVRVDGSRVDIDHTRQGNVSIPQKYFTEDLFIKLD
jgi:hypothetical protein